jgi:Na+/H+ antiporter NhaD/arsenite permease-like protein
MTLEQIVAGIIFLITFALILSEKIHRTIVAMAGAVTMVIAGLIMGFYSHHKAIEALNFETLGLLMGMMILVALLQETGFFEYVAIITAKRSRGNPWFLLVFLGSATTFISMFLDNVTTIILIAPVTLLITEILRINPIPILFGEAVLANIGGVATLVGDPPNIIIGSVAGFTFNDFLTHLAPIAIISWIATLFALKFMFKKELSEKTRNLEGLMSMDEKKALKNMANAKKICIVMVIVIITFAFQGKLGVTSDFIALAGAALALLLIRPDMEKIITHIEWNVLIFFASLFIAVGGLEASGIMDVIFNQKLIIIARIHEMFSDIILFWSGAMITAITGNIPFTIAMVPILKKLGVTSMWWALALGAGMGANITPIGSAANVIIISISEKTKTPITFKFWIKKGLPIMLLTGVISTVLFILLYLVGWMQTPDLSNIHLDSM